MNPGGGGCSEPRFHLCTPAGVTESIKKKKERKINKERREGGREGRRKKKEKERKRKKVWKICSLKMH